jgi:hypothetical protein
MIVNYIKKNKRNRKRENERVKEMEKQKIYIRAVENEIFVL